MKKFLHHTTKNYNFKNFSNKKFLSLQRQLSLKRKRQFGMFQKQFLPNGVLFVSKKTLLSQDSIPYKNKVSLAPKLKVLQPNVIVGPKKRKEKERQQQNRFAFTKTRTLNASYFFTLKLSPNFCNINDMNSQFSTKKQFILCSVSGGQDSNLNFFVLLYLKQENFLKIIYCHHFWQRQNFAGCLLTFQFSFVFDVPYFLIFPNSFLLTENSSRGWRKKNFCRISSLEKTSLFGTGHTQTDVLEKNLHNISRGVSSSSLNNQTFLNCKKTSIYYFSPVILNFKDYFDRFWKNKENILFLQNFFNHSSSKNFIFLPQTISKTEFLRPLWYQNCLFFFPSKNWSQEVLNKKNLQIRKTFQFFKTKKNRKTSLFFNSRRVQRTFTKIEKNDYGSFHLVQTLFVKQEMSFFKKCKCNFGKQKKTQSFSFCFYSKYFQSTVNFIQPLQPTHRATVSKLMNFYDFPVLTDLTNFSYQFSRNKIRHQVIPFIKNRFHRKIDSLLTTFFNTVENDNFENQKQVANLTFLCKFFEVLLLNNLMTDFLFFIFMFEKSKPKLYSSILHQTLSDYLEIQITFSQTRKIKNQLSLVPEIDLTC